MIKKEVITCRILQIQESNFVLLFSLLPRKMITSTELFRPWSWIDEVKCPQWPFLWHWDRLFFHPDDDVTPSYVDVIYMNSDDLINQKITFNNSFVWQRMAHHWLTFSFVKSLKFESCNVWLSPLFVIHLTYDRGEHCRCFLTHPTFHIPPHSMSNVIQCRYLIYESHLHENGQFLSVLMCDSWNHW